MSYNDSVRNEINELMNIDHCDIVKRNDVFIIIQKVLNQPSYFQSLKSNFDIVLKDKKIDTNDIPMLIMIMIDLNTMLSGLLGLSNSVSLDKIKYIFYAMLFVYISQYQPAFFSTINQSSFRGLYNTLWDLIEVVPDTLKIAKQKISSCCK